MIIYDYDVYIQNKHIHVDLSLFSGEKWWYFPILSTEIADMTKASPPLRPVVEVSSLFNLLDMGLYNHVIICKEVSHIGIDCKWLWWLSVNYARIYDQLRIQMIIFEKKTVKSLEQPTQVFHTSWNNVHLKMTP